MKGVFMNTYEIELIEKALSAAESSISVAKRLLLDSERGGSRSFSNSRPLPHKEGNFREKKNPSQGNPAPQPVTSGVTGFFDGQNMVAANGEKYPVPPNYVSKSMIVAGDQLKMIKEGGETLFKQIQRTKRKRLAGVLALKEGKFNVLTDEGSFKVLNEAVEHFGLKAEDRVEILTSATQKTFWAVVERALEKEENESPSPVKEENKSQVKDEIKGEVVIQEVAPQKITDKEETAAIADIDQKVVEVKDEEEKEKTTEKKEKSKDKKSVKEPEAKPKKEAPKKDGQPEADSEELR